MIGMSEKSEENVTMTENQVHRIVKSCKVQNSKGPSGKWTSLSSFEFPLNHGKSFSPDTSVDIFELVHKLSICYCLSMLLSQRVLIVSSRNAFLVDHTLRISNLFPHANLATSQARSHC